MKHPRLGAAVAALGWTLVAPAAGLAVARATRREDSPLVIAAQAVAPSGLVLASLALALALAARRRMLALVAGPLVAANVRWMLPELAPARPVPDKATSAPRLRLASANVFTLNRQISGLAAELLALDADVVALQEVTEANLAGLRRHGLVDAYPHHLLNPRADAFGTAILSRLPLADPEVWQAAQVPMTRATVLVEGIPVRLYCVHPRAPFGPTGLPRWRDQLDALRKAIATEPRPLVVAGDFNATYGQRPFRDLLAEGLRDAHVERGRGWVTTWPRDLPLVPALARIDHVLVSPEVAVLSVGEGDGVGSDHRPVVADLAVLG